MTDSIASDLKKMGYKNPASVLSQKNILEGIEKTTGQMFDAIGVISLSGFPKQKDIIYREMNFSHGGESKDVLVGFLNLRYINKIVGKKSLVKSTKAWAKQYKEDEVHIFVYEMRSACLAAARKVKEIIPRTKIHLIVPDLPQYMDLHMNHIKRILKEIDWKKIRRYFSYVDDFILYAQPMADFLKIENRPYIVMEGSINLNEINEIRDESADNDKYVVMYSGSIQAGFKIENLLKAFEYLGDNYELWITGGGNAKDTVQSYANKDSRIKYFGYLPTRQDLKRLQSKATMFVNMRDPAEMASSYCFPSKIFEYMLTGKPVLSCKLKGIPGNYFNYLVEIKSIEPIDIANAIEKTASLSSEERNEIGYKSRDFIIKEKNNVVQAKHIVDFINS